MLRLSGLCRANVVIIFYQNILSNPALLMPVPLIVYPGFLFPIYSPFSPRIHRVSIIFPLYPSFVRHFYVICVIIDETVDDAFFISLDFARRSDWSDSVCPIGFYQNFPVNYADSVCVIVATVSRQLSTQWVDNYPHSVWTIPVSM